MAISAVDSMIIPSEILIEEECSEEKIGSLGGREIFLERGEDESKISTFATKALKATYGIIGSLVILPIASMGICITLVVGVSMLPVAIVLSPIFLAGYLVKERFSSSQKSPTG